MQGRVCWRLSLCGTVKSRVVYPHPPHACAIRKQTRNIQSTFGSMASGDVQAANERDEAVKKSDDAQATPETEAGDGGEAEQPLSKNQLKKRAKYARYARLRPSPPHPPIL